jgi:hypothetical protein
VLLLLGKAEGSKEEKSHFSSRGKKNLSTAVGARARVDTPAKAHHITARALCRGVTSRFFFLFFTAGGVWGEAAVRRERLSSRKTVSRLIFQILRLDACGNFRKQQKGSDVTGRYPAL